MHRIRLKGFLTNLFGEAIDFLRIVINKKNRDWFSISFRLLIDSNQTLEEKSSRKYNIWEHIGTRPAIDVAPQMAARFQGVLKRGLEVIFHQKSGDIIRNAILRISDADGDKADSSLTLQFVDNKNWLGIWSKPTILVHLSLLSLFSLFIAVNKFTLLLDVTTI